MTLVPAGDERYSPRVGPKVFSDVPTQQEVSSVKRRAGLLLLLCAFFVALAAAGVAYFLWVQAQRYPDQDEPGGARAQIDQLRADVAARDTQLGERQALFDPYRDISDAEEDVRRTIRLADSLMAERPNARERLAIFRDEWKAYDELRARWWVDDQIQEIQDRSRRLPTLVSELRRLPTTPPPQAREGTTAAAAKSPACQDTFANQRLHRE